MNFVCGCAAVGYAKSKQQILSLVSNVVKKKGIQEAAVTDGWRRSSRGDMVSSPSELPNSWRTPEQLPHVHK